MMRALIISLLTCLLGGASLRGQDETRIQLRFLFLDESRSAYFLQLEDETVRLSAAPYSISPPITVQYGQTLNILQANTSRKSEARREILNIQAPDQGNSALVVVEPQSGKSSDYRYSILETGSARRDPQSLQIFNLGLTETAVLIGESKALIPAGETKLMNINPDAKHRVIAKVGERTTEGWRMLYDGVIALRPEQKMTAVIVYSPTGLRYTYTKQEIQEFGEPEPGHFWLTFLD